LCSQASLSVALEQQRATQYAVAEKGRISAPVATVAYLTPDLQEVRFAIVLGFGTPDKAMR
jgi:hypothetical protein